jgi:hypothetical protein
MDTTQESNEIKDTLLNLIQKIESINKEEILTEKDKRLVIVRDNYAGVFFGAIISKKGKTCKLIDVRRIWYWDGAASLSQLAEEGVSKPENCKFPCKVSQIELLDIAEVIEVTPKAIESINNVPIWSC